MSEPLGRLEMRLLPGEISRFIPPVNWRSDTIPIEEICGCHLSSRYRRRGGMFPWSFRNRNSDEVQQTVWNTHLIAPLARSIDFLSEVGGNDLLFNYQYVKNLQGVAVSCKASILCQIPNGDSYIIQLLVKRGMKRNIDALVQEQLAYIGGSCFLADVAVGGLLLVDLCSPEESWLTYIQLTEEETEEGKQEFLKLFDIWKTEQGLGEHARVFVNCKHCNFLHVCPQIESICDFVDNNYPCSGIMIHKKFGERAFNEIKAIGSIYYVPSTNPDPRGNSNYWASNF